MNKLLKYGLAILLIGFGIVLVISLTSNSTIFGINEENYTLTEESYAGDAFDSINFDFDNRHVYITESTDDQIHVKFYLHEKDELTYSDTTSNLNIEISRKWYFSIFTFDIFTNKDYFRVLLSLPTSTTIENLDINTSNGELELNVANVFDSIILATSNGRIDLMNFTVNDLVANSANGDVLVDEVNAVNSINLKTSNGGIDLSEVTAPDIKANTSNGRITAEGIISEDITLDTSNGRIYLAVKGIKDDYRVTLTTSNGDEIYDGLKVASGTINTSGTKKIVLDSSNGDVEVAFTN
jgi:DUF4097 and DUF4098 domain-containing protein YvlB